MNTRTQTRLPYGCLAHLRTRTGRRRLEPSDGLESSADPFIEDEKAILGSKAFRLLDCKTQVITLPNNDLIRNRMKHTMEVVACSITISDILGLNTNLVRAASLGHDIGHIPFGHPGERCLADMMRNPRFCHEVMGPIIAQRIERKGEGLNLTHETLEAMMRHSGSTTTPDMSQEARVVRCADKVAYLFSDYNDITQRMGWQVCRELAALMDEFGSNQRERVFTATQALVLESAEKRFVSFESSDIAQKFWEIRRLMNEVYPRMISQDPRRLIEPVVGFLKGLNVGDPFLIFALMTDKDVMHMMETGLPDMCRFQQTAGARVLPYLADIGDVDLCDPGLDW